MNYRHRNMHHTGRMKHAVVTPGIEPGEPYEPIILPGESLAKYRDRNQSPNEVAAAPEDESRGRRRRPLRNFLHRPLRRKFRFSKLRRNKLLPLKWRRSQAPLTESAQPPAEHRAVENPLRASKFRTASSGTTEGSYAPRWQASGGIEPLPGESIAKFRNKETLPKETAATTDSPAVSSEESGIPESVFAPFPR